MVQIWSGLVARTAPGWSLLVRRPANLPRSLAYEVYEGIVETDRWFGPLFINIRLTRTNVPIELNPELPFLQVQPVNRELYGNALEQFEIVTDLEHLRPDEWNAFQKTVVRPNVDPHRQQGRIRSCGTASVASRSFDPIPRQAIPLRDRSDNRLLTGERPSTLQLRGIGSELDARIYAHCFRDRKQRPSRARTPSRKRAASRESRTSVHAASPNRLGSRSG